MDDEKLARVRKNGQKPVRITATGDIFIGGEQVLLDHPIKQGSISVTPWRGRLNQLTLTLIVGEVNMELRPPRSDADVDEAIGD